MAKVETLEGQPSLPKKKKLWQILLAATGVPAAFLAGWLYLGRDKGPVTTDENPRLPIAGPVLSEATPEPTPTLISLSPPTPESMVSPIPTVEIPKTLPSIISLETLKEAGIPLVTWTPQEIEKAQQEALTNDGELKLPIPKEFLEEKGEIRHRRVIINGKPMGTLYFIMPRVASISFPALTPGEVVLKDQQKGSFIGIKVGKFRVNYHINPTTEFRVSDAKMREKISVGQLIISGEFNPDVDTQRNFEGQTGNPRFTAIALGLLDLEINVGSDPKLENLLRDEKGRLVAVSLLTK